MNAPALTAEVLAARLRAEEKKLALVQDVGRALASNLDLDKLLAVVMERITALMEADRSTLFLLSDDGATLWSKVMQGDEVKEIRLKVGEGIAGWVAKSGDVVNIPDAYADARFQPAVDKASGYRTSTILCMPMRAPNGVIIGVVQVLNKQGGAFSEDDEALLVALSGFAAIALENARLYRSLVRQNIELSLAKRALEEKTRELELLYQIEHELGQAWDEDDLLERVLRRALSLIGAQAGSVALRDSGTDLVFRSATGAASEKVKRLRVPLGKGVVGWVVSQRTAAIVNNPAEDARHDAKCAAEVGWDPEHLLVVPLFAGEACLGAIELLDKTDADGLPSSQGFTKGDQARLEMIAGALGRALEGRRAREASQREDRLASIGQMLSGVLHDLKTPMTVVSGYAQLMAQSDDAAQREEYVEAILKQFDLMGAMTREVLLFAKGQSNILVRRVYLHKFFEEVARQLEHAFAGKGVTFKLDTGYDGVAWFDEQKLLRVIHNLARNAAQAMPSGGTFTMRTRVDDHWLTFEFEDTGTGLPKEMEGRLFQLFATAGKKDGTGLGLAIVRKIVEDHGGSIGYRSTPGQGTTFIVALPREKPANVMTTGETPIAMVGGSRK